MCTAECRDQSVSGCAGFLVRVLGIDVQAAQGVSSIWLNLKRICATSVCAQVFGRKLMSQLAVLTRRKFPRSSPPQIKLTMPVGRRWLDSGSCHTGGQSPRSADKAAEALAQVKLRAISSPFPARIGCG
jgi:hypothetical protein